MTSSLDSGAFNAPFDNSKNYLDKLKVGVYYTHFPGNLLHGLIFLYALMLHHSSLFISTMVQQNLPLPKNDALL